MSTLQSYIDKLNPIFKLRYSTGGYFVTWANELLELLQSRGFMPEIRQEAGKIVVNDRWIEKPTDLVRLLKVMDPCDRHRQIRVEEINNKYQLLDYEVNDQSAAEQTLVTAFSDYALGSVKVNLTGYGLDSFEDYLFLITAGTYAGKAYILSGNDASGVSDTKINFMHNTTSLLDGTKVTAGRLVPPYFYYILQYVASYEKLTATSDELPIDDKFEMRLVPAFLEWRAQKAASLISQETLACAVELNNILQDIESSRNSGPVNPAKGRRLIGFERGHGSSRRSDDRSFNDVHGI